MYQYHKRTVKKNSKDYCSLVIKEQETIRFNERDHTVSDELNRLGNI